MPKRRTVCQSYSEEKSLKRSPIQVQYVDTDWTELRQDTVQPCDSTVQPLTVPLIQNSSMEFMNIFKLRKAEHTVCICLRTQEI